MAKAVCTHWTIPEFWSQMEGIIVPELAGEGSEIDVFQLQQQIRGHTIRQEFTAKGKNWESCLESAINDATSKNFGFVKAESGRVDKDGNQVVPVSYFRSNFLDSMQEPIEDAITAVLEGNEIETDDALYKLLMRKAAYSAAKGSQQTGVSLFDQEIAFARWKSTAKYMAPNEITGDVWRDFGVLSTRIMHSEWQEMYKSKKDEIDQGNMPSQGDFSKVYAHAMRKAWAIMPERFKSTCEFDENFKNTGHLYETHLELFRTMFTPEAYMRELLEDVSYEASIFQQETAKVAEQREKTVGKGGDTFSIISKFHESLETVKAATATRWLGGTRYEPGNRQHACIAAENIYYRALERLASAFGADRTVHFQTHLFSERQTLRLEKDGIDSHIGELRIGDDESTRVFERFTEIEKRLENIGARLEKSSTPPPDSQFESVLEDVKKEIKTLFGEDSSPISRKILDDIKKDYCLHNQPMSPVWAIISPLYTHLSLVLDESTKTWTVEKEKSAMTPKAWEIAENAINASREKNRNTTEQVFGNLVSGIRTELKKTFLNGQAGKGRYEYYDELKASLGDKDAVKDFMAESRSGMFEFLVKSAFRHYDSGRIDRKKAEQLLDRIRNEEIAYTIYFTTCTNLEESLKEKNAEANENMIEEVRMIAASKARILVPEFKSAIERKYPAKAEPDEEGRMLTESTRKALLGDFEHGNYFNDDVTANRAAGNWQKYVDECALPIAWVEMWQVHGDSRPSAEQMHEAYREAISYAAAFNPKLAEASGIRTFDDIERVMAQERGEKTAEKYMKNLRREHMPRYMETIRSHKQKLEEMYFSHDNLLPRNVVAAGYEKTWFDEKVRPIAPVVFFKV